MKSKIKVAIPLKTNSERVPNKNLRPFYNGKSLFDIKAEQLLKVFEGSDVYVSSENPIVGDLCRNYGFNFHLRDESLTKSTAKETQIVRAVTAPIPKEYDVMWVQVTQPLFEDFEAIKTKWEELDNSYDSLTVVKRINHHLLDEKGNPVNFNFGYWSKISQDLPIMYEATWAASIMKREMLEEAFYQIGRKPYLFDEKFPMLDINTMEDFEIAQILYEKYKGKNCE